jgi:hypothetical protein
MKTVTVIRAVEFANGAPCPHAGQWLKSFDHNAYKGRGYGVYTDDPRKALRFASPGEAMAFWARQADVNPIRPDGQPNKPLTALTASFEQLVL